jgi:DNA-binding response OmpR family regulator
VGASAQGFPLEIRATCSGRTGGFPAYSARVGTSKRALILVVEKDAHVRELEAFFLDQAGFDVEFAADGASALARARELRPQIIITEVLVPKMDGLSLCRQLKTDPETANILVLVFSVLAAGLRAREAGADAFLQKPLAEGELPAMVKSLLSRPRSKDDRK